MRWRFLLLLLCCTAVLHAQIPYGIKWQKNFGGSKTERAADILPTSDSGQLVIGYSFSNDGDVSGHHGTTSTADGWIFRLSSSHQILWQKSFGGSGNDFLKSAIKTADGNYVVIGTSTTADFDVTNNFGGKDIWVIKIDANGNLIWSKSFGGSGTDSAGNIVELPGGSFMITGSTNSVNGQVPATYANNTTAIWYFKISASGDFISGRKMGTRTVVTGLNRGEDIRLLPDGNIIMSVNVDVDPEPDSDFPTQSISDVQPWLIKTDTAGDIIWKKPGGRPGGTFNYIMPRYNAALQLTPFGISIIQNGDPAGGMATMQNNEFFTFLNRYDGASTNLWKNFGEESSYPGPQRNVILSNYSSTYLADSNLLIAGYWQHADPTQNKAFLVKKKFAPVTDPAPKFFGGSADDGFVAIRKDYGNRYIIAGFSASSDGDLTGNNGEYDAWIAGITDSAEIKKNYISGLAFIDKNNNNTFDAGDQPFDQFKVSSSKSGQEVLSIPYGGVYYNEVDTGSYETKVLVNEFYSVTPASGNSNFSTYGNENKINFIISSIPGKRNYEASLIAVTPARPGFNVTYEAVVKNTGTDVMQNTQVEVIKDSNLIFVSSVPAPSYQDADTLRWVLNNIGPDSTFKIPLEFTTKTPPELNYGDTLISFITLDTTGDLRPDDNTNTLLQIVTGSYDPNDKIATNAGAMSKTRYDQGEYIYYTIRFQNTGNDTAFNVIVTDTLSNRFERGSLEMITASHPYQLNLVKDSIWTWKFSRILLVDSNRNEPASHGYVSFRIKPVTGLATGSTIINDASIYFDYNLPVITDAHTTTIVIFKPELPLLNNLKNVYCKNEGAQTITISNFTAGITTVVKLNGNDVTLSNDQFTINPGTLNNGENTIRVSFANAAGSSEKDWKFTITAPVTPEIDVTASSLIVTDQSPAITVNITTPVEGGSSPLFTFAKDKNFIQIIQASSNSTSITIQPATLAIGDNKIYAKMETSVACYSDKFAIDSVVIVKSAPTGIIDPEFPGTKILVGPNPFNNTITVSGLQRSKSYLVTLVNASGQIVWKRQFRNSDRLVIQENFPSGIYWLHLTDEKKKKSLGSFSLYH